MAELRRHALLVTALAALLSTLVTAPASAAPVTAAPATAAPARAAAGWLARQMIDGERFEAVFDGVAYPDQGLTIDATFAFSAARTAGDYADRAVEWLAEPQVLTGYIGDGSEAYAGATAKLALAAQVQGLDPTAFGGVDLLTRLRGLLTASGRFSDRSAFGDYSNAFSQSFALLTLDRAGSAPPSAISFLAATRCPDGGFPLQFGQATCVSEVDSTAMVAQALIATGRRADAAPALTWLAAQQLINANSAGLAAQAFADADEISSWWHARQFLLSLRVSCTGAPEQRGAIAYDATGFDPATAARATAQAVPGLTGTGFARLTAAHADPAAPVPACREN